MGKYSYGIGSELLISLIYFRLTSAVTSSSVRFLGNYFRNAFEKFKGNGEKVVVEMGEYDWEYGWHVCGVNFPTV